MARDSVNEIAALINQQIEFQEKIEGCLSKLETLLSLSMLVESFYELPKAILQNFFSIALYLVTESLQTIQQSISILLNQSG